jgi:hypothetical protein
MLVRLLELGLSRRLSWQEVADIQADHETDLAAAIEQAADDVEFGDWWNGRPLRTARSRAMFAVLQPRRSA